MVESNVIIRLEDLTYTYSGNSSKPRVLNGLHLHIRRGERVGLIGVNGSGKTTLFHLIMGLLSPIAGEIVLFGRRRQGEKDFREVRQKIGLLFQDSDDQLFCPTVAEDVAFGPLNLGKNQEEALAITHEVLTRLGLKGFENRLTHKLSGGEKRLVSLATVLAMTPEVLLLDEPTTGLDEGTVHSLIQLLRESTLTYIIASHDRDFLSKTTTIVYRLEQGQVVRAG